MAGSEFTTNPPSFASRDPKKRREAQQPPDDSNGGSNSNRKYRARSAAPFPGYRGRCRGPGAFRTIRPELIGDRYAAGAIHQSIRGPRLVVAIDSRRNKRVSRSRLSGHEREKRVSHLFIQVPSVSCRRCSCLMVGPVLNLTTRQQKSRKNERDHLLEKRPQKSTGNKSTPRY